MDQVAQLPWGFKHLIGSLGHKVEDSDIAQLPDGFNQQKWWFVPGLIETNDHPNKNDREIGSNHTCISYSSILEYLQEMGVKELLQLGEAPCHPGQVQDRMLSDPRCQ